MKMALIAHVDTTRVNYDMVKAVPTPDRTRTWGVVGHGDFVDLLAEAVHANNYDITKQEYSLSKDGGKMFGIFTLDVGDPEGARMIGFRNSINKTLAAGITAGRRVFVCDNLAFSGEFIDYYKHVGRLTVAVLKDAAFTAISTVDGKMKVFEEWHRELHVKKMTKTDAQVLTFRAIESGVLPAGNFSRFYDLFFEKVNNQNAAVYEDDLYGFHGAMTQIWGQNSLISTGPRHGGLVKLIDDAVIDLDTNGEIRDAA
jgi:hypothetical protein